MGAQWKHTGRIANSSKRGALISKLVKEIMVAAKVGGPSIEGNARLRAAVEAAKKSSVPRDNIERAIKKGSGQLDDGVQIDLITYEGFAPHQVPLMVECLTDNRNRTAADIRVLFRKGQLGSGGSVSWMFDRVGLIEAAHPDRSQDLESVAIEVGAQNFEPMSEAEVGAGQLGGRFFTDPADLDAVNRALTTAGWVITQSELSYQAKNKVEVSDAQRKEVIEFLDAVDDHDDVHRLYVAF
jgi:YebC/PmpR family DNA-binding regulatory protein